uniref:Repulsive guidance molecule A n=1 Tax=Hydra vulgaris TaxID=6087 RepID=T2M8F9_HYDVU
MQDSNSMPMLLLLVIQLVLVDSFRNFDDFPLHEPLQLEDEHSNNMPNNEPDCSRCVNMFRLSETEYISSKDTKIFCIRLLQVKRCIQKEQHSCQRNIGVLVLNTGVTIKQNWHKCSDFKISVNDIKNIFKKQKNIPDERCKYMQTKSDLSEFKHCGMFGDPHIKTFSDQRQTCVVEGTWSLLDNDFIAVQVTNEMVQETKSQSATATTKISIVIKEPSDKCVDQKIYEATSQFLPSIFKDGTYFTGPDACRTALIKPNDNEIRIILCHINTTLFIKRIGNYLTFNIKTPNEFVNQSTGLCIVGCPASEMVDYNTFFAIKDNTVVSPTLKDKAINICNLANLTDFYYDSCVFDILSTGDMNFAKAASISLQDARSLDSNIRLRRENSILLRDQLNIDNSFDESVSSEHYSPSRLKSSSCEHFNRTHLVILSVTSLLAIYLR